MDNSAVSDDIYGVFEYDCYWMLDFFGIIDDGVGIVVVVVDVIAGFIGKICFFRWAVSSLVRNAEEPLPVEI